MIIVIKMIIIVILIIYFYCPAILYLLPDSKYGYYYPSYDYIFS